MKVKVIKANLPTYWYAERVGEVFEVVDVSSNTLCPELGFVFKSTDEQTQRYFDLDDVEIVKEEKQMFDMKKEKWFIRTPTDEVCQAVQLWLFGQGFEWQQYGKQVMFLNDEHTCAIHNHHDYKEQTIWRNPNNEWEIEELVKSNYKEIKLTFKTIVDSVEYPETKSAEQLQLEVLQGKIAELNREAEKLQKLVQK